MFLEGMAKEGEEPDNTPPRSVADPDDYVKRTESIRNDTRSPQIYSPAPRSKVSDTILGAGGGTPLFGNREEVKSNGRHNDIYDDDADSNVQEGIRSEMGDAMMVCNSLGLSLIFTNTVFSMNPVPMTLLAPSMLRMTLDLHSAISGLYRQRINPRQLQTTHTLVDPGLFVRYF